MSIKNFPLLMACLTATTFFSTAKAALKSVKLIAAILNLYLPSAANIGEAIIKDRALDPESEHNDIIGIRKVMMEIMEPNTLLCDGLEYPGKWGHDSAILNFLKAIQTESLGDLKRV